MTTPYKPRDGSIAHRARLILERDGELATAPLADAIDCEQHTLLPSLTIAIREGYIAKRKAGGLNYFKVGDGLAIVDDDPLKQRTVAAADSGGIDMDAAHRQVGSFPPATETTPEASPRVGAMGTGQAADAAPAGRLEVLTCRTSGIGKCERELAGREFCPGGRCLEHDNLETVADVIRAVAPAMRNTRHENPRADFRCALWSDGRLTLAFDNDERVLSVEQTRSLCHYLECMSLPEAAA